MKILRLRFTNLNSLKGETRIEFEEGPLSRTGLFAITGPTGAGKTTILDAITLALYGRVARYGNTANPENIMSRHTGEASAELEFACTAGRFRCLWLRQRARKKPEGKLQPPKRQVIDVATGAILCEKIADTDRKVCELTGLDYDRFLRSVLLAQGDFAAFLKAGPKERTELLQELTGTGIYQDISAAAFRRAADAKLACEALRREHETVLVLDEESLRSRKTELAEAEARVSSLAGHLQVLGERLRGAEKRRGLETEQQELQSRRGKLIEARETNRHELERLGLHEKALPLRGRLEALDRLEAEQVRDTGFLEELAGRLPGLEQTLQQATERLHAARKAIADEELRQENTRLLWTEVEELDRQLAAAKEAGQQLRRQHESQKARFSSLETQLERLIKDGQQSLVLAQAEAAWLETHADRAGLGERLPELQEILTRWEGQDKTLSEISLDLDRSHKERLELDMQVEEARRALPSLRDQVLTLEQRCTQLETQLRERSAAAGLEELERQAVDLAQAHAERLRHGDAAKHLRTRSAALEHARTELHEVQSQLVQAKTLAEARKHAAEAAFQLMEARRQTHDLAKLLQSLEQHRNQLAADAPCPLCGSKHHPYANPAALPSPELGATLRDFQQAETAYYEAADKLTQAEKSEAGLQAEVQRRQLEQEQEQTRLAELTAAWATAGAKLGLSLSVQDEEGLEHASREAKLAQEAVTRTMGELRAEQAQVQTARDLCRQAKEQRALAEAALRSREELLQRSRTECATKLTRLESLRAALQAEKQTFTARHPGGLAEPVGSREARDRLQLLKRQVEEWNAHRERKAELDKQLRVQDALVESQRAQHQEAAVATKALEGQVETALSAYRVLAERRRALFGEASPAEARRQAVEVLRQLNDHANTEARAEAQAGLAREGALKEHRSLSQLLQTRGTDTAVALEELTQAWTTLGFANRSTLRAALLSEQDAERLRSLRRELEEENTRLETLASNLQTQLRELPAKSAEDTGRLADLRDELALLASSRDETNRRAGQLQELLANDEAQRRRQAKVLDKMEAGRAEYLRWEALSALIGSADGAVFSRFAQGLTLDRLSLLANRHLAQLNPRYTLRRMSGEAGENLELEILDLYQASVARPMASLSGGESFLASLALALALSELAGGKTRIESLFIDEGFGTLDADTLETAMAALENLQAGGKTIGLISHVPSMRERIPTQIQVLKKPGGVSEVQVVGP